MANINFREFKNIQFLMAFMLIVFNVTKHEEECHILNQFIPNENNFLYVIYKNNHINSFNINN